MESYQLRQYPADIETCTKAADYIKSKISIEPEIGIILGTGLGPLADMIDVDAIIPYSEIPGFPRSTAPKHKGNLIAGTLGKAKVLCMQGRFHYYEGYEYLTLALSIRTLSLCGIKVLIQTNAAGAVNLNYRPGDIMIISDHINLYASNPTRGQESLGFGDRFYDTQHMYPKALRDIARFSGKCSPLIIHEGVYMFMPGPNFETPAEIRAMRLLGADAAGMSTVPESLTAAQMNLPVLGFSVITNMGSGITDEILTSEDVERIADIVSHDFSTYMKQVINGVKDFLDGPEGQEEKIL